MSVLSSTFTPCFKKDIYVCDPTLWNTGNFTQVIIQNNKKSLWNRDICFCTGKKCLARSSYLKIIITSDNEKLMGQIIPIRSLGNTYEIILNKKWI
jgi:hypothetical protein